jgi:hypothetical protein
MISDLSQQSFKSSVLKPIGPLLQLYAVSYAEKSFHRTLSRPVHLHPLWTGKSAVTADITVHRSLFKLSDNSSKRILATVSGAVTVLRCGDPRLEGKFQDSLFILIFLRAAYLLPQTPTLCVMDIDCDLRDDWSALRPFICDRYRVFRYGEPGGESAARTHIV